MAAVRIAAHHGYRLDADVLDFNLADFASGRHPGILNLVVYTDKTEGVQKRDGSN
jgi:hypothetical protein